MKRIDFKAGLICFLDSLLSKARFGWILNKTFSTFPILCSFLVPFGPDETKLHFNIYLMILEQIDFLHSNFSEMSWWSGDLGLGRTQSQVTFPSPLRRERVWRVWGGGSEELWLYITTLLCHCTPLYYIYSTKLHITSPKFETKARRPWIFPWCLSSKLTFNKL